MLEFQLTDDHLYVRDHISREWHQRAKQRNAAQRHYNPVRGVELDLVSITGQLGAALVLDRVWFGDSPYVGSSCQIEGCVVKTITQAGRGLLVPLDTIQPLEMPWVLVLLDLACDGHGWVLGWMQGIEAQSDRYFRDNIRDPAYIVSTRFLYPLDELPS